MASYRFLLYNIRYGTGSGGWRFHAPVPFSGYLRKTDRVFPEISAFIRSYDPDMVGLVEVDGGSGRSNGINQARQVARELGYHCVFQNKYSPHPMTDAIPILGKQGNAVLARHEILGHRYHYFQKGVKRLIIEVEMEDVVLFLVHLSLHPGHRRMQLAELSLLIRGVGKPVIVGGDFNVFNGSRELEGFLSATGLKSANAGNVRTFPSTRPRWELDYILHSRQVTVDDMHAPPVRLSDHLPLVCDFTVK
ncbi:MAG: endonuclease/exonuclease/phosphatase family protein [Thermodesulfobacteriota bacterium]